MQYGSYIGRVSSIPADKPYGFIAIGAVRKADNDQPDITTQADTFLHPGDCDSPLWVGMEVKFVAYDDDKRGEGFYRARHAIETSASRIEKLAKGGIELSMQGLGSDRYLEQSSVFASWCIFPALAARIKEKKLDNLAVYLLLVYWPEEMRARHTEVRQLVDLMEPMAIVGFNSPGINRVVALVVYDQSEGGLRDTYFTRHNGCYKTDIIGSDDDTIVIGEGGWKNGRLGSGYIEVGVPQELFAKQPRDWGWVNSFFNTPPRDQCAFRRRRIFAYTLQPVVWSMLLAIVGFMGAIAGLVNLICIVCLLSVGVRGINYAPLRHPFQHKPRDIWEGLQRPVFVPIIKERHVPLPIAVSPLVLIVAGIFTQLISGAPFGTLAWFTTFGKVMLTPIILFGLISLFVMWSEGIDWDEHKRLQAQEQRQRLAVEVDELICTTTGPRKPDVWQLPFRPKTIRFYAHALKQKVCRGFAAAA
jgi:hypothetical protein